MSFLRFIIMFIAANSMNDNAGYLSAYNKNPTVATMEYRQSIGDIPMDLSRYDGVIAVLDCSKIGAEATLLTVSGSLDVIVFDCAGRSDGGAEWMASGNFIAEVGWGIWQKHPEIIHSRAVLYYIGEKSEMGNKIRARTIARAIVRHHEFKDGDIIALKKNEWDGDVVRVFESMRHILADTDRKKCIVVVVDEWDDIKTFNEEEMKGYGWCKYEQADE